MNKNSYNERTTNVLKSYLPIMEWGAMYNRKTFTNDLIVAVIVAIMLVPQSLAYAQLAGLPPEVGLYASMAPLVLYAIFGTSRSLSVGPVAVTSLDDTCSSCTNSYPGNVLSTWQLLWLLALLTGVILLVLGFLKLGFLSNFMSFPVMSGLGTAVGIQIATSQLTPYAGDPF